MAEFPQPLFSVGQRVYDAQSRTGLVTDVVFAQAVNGYRYLVAGIQDIFEESELQATPFPAPAPLTWLESAIEDLAISVARNPGLDVRWWTARRLGVPADVIEETPSQPGGGTLDGALGYWAARGYSPPLEPGQQRPYIPPIEERPTAPAPTPLDLMTVLIQVDQRIATAIALVVDGGLDARQELEGRIITRLAELAALTNQRFAARGTEVAEAIERLEASLAALEEETEEGAGMGIRGLLAFVAGFVANPLGWFLDRAGEAIQAEIVDGLNR